MGTSCWWAVRPGRTKPRPVRTGGLWGDRAKPLNCMTALDADDLAARVVACLPPVARG